MNKHMSLKQAKAMLPAPAAMKSASQEFRAWFSQLDKKTSSPRYIVDEFSKSNVQLLQGLVSNESQRLLQLGDWAAGVAVGKVNRQAKQKLVLPALSIAYCAYSLILDKPPADLGSLQLQEIKKKQGAVCALTLMVVGIVPIRHEAHIPTPADFVQVSFHSKF